MTLQNGYLSKRKAAGGQYETRKMAKKITVKKIQLKSELKSHKKRLIKRNKTPEQNAAKYCFSFYLLENGIMI